MNQYNLKVGDKIYFATDKRSYTVKAINDFFTICTKPFNLKKLAYIQLLIGEKGNEIETIWYLILTITLNKKTLTNV